MPTLPPPARALAGAGAVTSGAPTPQAATEAPRAGTATPSGSVSCPIATAVTPVDAGPGPLLRLAADTGTGTNKDRDNDKEKDKDGDGDGDKNQNKNTPTANPTSRPSEADGAAAAPAPGGDYRRHLATTALGWPRLERWCVWIEPPASGEPSPWDQRWLAAVEQALAQWQRHLPIQRVEDPAAAQVRLWRRRPPLLVGPDGRRRASHGRATLELRRVTRDGTTVLEPSVEVLLSPGQRPVAIEATALHELGHAFGLWGHSDRAADAMAAVPGSAPVLELTPRDLATLRWLYRQPSRFGSP